MKRTALTILFLLLFLPLDALGQAAAPQAAASGLGFGGAVAIAGDAIFVGSSPIGWPRGEEPAGLVYRFTRDAEGTWTEAERFHAADARFADTFGRVLLAHGATLVVSAPGSGATYVFERDDTGAWAERARLSPSALAPGAEFGGSYERGGYRTGTLAMAGERVFVAATHTDGTPGAVYVFQRHDGGWHEEAILRPDTPEEAKGFGWTIAATDEQVFVSAAGADNQRGAVYVFAREASGAWFQQSRLTSDETAGRSNLGQSLVFHAGRLYAGAPGFERHGAVFVFEKGSKTGAWAQTARLDAPESQGEAPPARGFGADLAVSERTMLVGARRVVFAFPMADGRPDVADAQQLDPPDVRRFPGFGVGLATHGTVAVVGSPTADYEAGLATVFEQQDGAWQPTAMLASDVALLPSISGGQVDCEDGTAALFGCDNVDLVSFLSLEEISSNRGVKATDLWGWEDPQTGTEYVLQARTDGVAFVDISDPFHPVYVGELMRTEGSPGSAWRDVKVYKDHAFIVADGAAEHGVQIFDLNQLRDVAPEAMPVTFEQTAHYSGVNSTHNIVINEETGFAYAVGNRAGGETCGGQLHMIDIRDPRNPQFAGCFTHAGAGGTHDAQCVIYRGPDGDYQGREVCFISNGSSFIIADVTDKEDPQSLAHTSYPSQAYTHQGWLTEDQQYFYMNDELDELSGGVPQTRTLIWDVQDLDDPLLVKEFLLNTKASDHNLYVKDNLLYQSNYQSGLRILDISDPINPLEVGHFDTVPWGEDAPGFGGSWSNYPYFRSGIIAVSSRGEGLFLVKKREIDM